MEYVPLGHSGIEVSRICIGGMSFGEPDTSNHEWTISPEDTEKVIKHAFEGGINYIDTANCYSHGTSEEYIGRALKNLGIPRDEVVLQSKVFFNEGGLSAAAIAREIDGTLSRLGTDYLDVYMIHRFDYNTPIDETLEALNALVKVGKVRALGASEMFAYQLHNLQVAAEANGWTKSPTCSATTTCSTVRMNARRSPCAANSTWRLPLTAHWPRGIWFARHGILILFAAERTLPWQTSTTGRKVWICLSSRALLNFRKSAAFPCRR